MKSMSRFSGSMIAGNKYNYIGDDSDLNCAVESIVDSKTFNATCGEEQKSTATGRSALSVAERLTRTYGFGIFRSEPLG
jgi:hypothetical protein